MTARTRIAVLGGGAASLATVYALTSEQDWRERYEITVYQLGWRLGGKGASSRDPERRGRNEEHGLHVFGGFYHNTFAMLRECYSDWNRIDPRFAFPMTEAFVKVPECTLMDAADDGRMLPIDLPFPTNDLDPGDNPPDPGPFVMLERMLRYVRDMVLRAAAPDLQAGGLAGIGQAWLGRRLAALASGFDRLLRRAFRDAASQTVSRPFERAAQALLAIARDLLLLIEPHLRPPARQINPAMAGAIVAIFAHGFLKHRLHVTGYGVLDDVDTLDWLRANGANDRVIDSAYMRGGYDYVFAFAGGVTDPPERSLAASVGVKWFLRFMLTYHGALFYHLNGGMGEVVFTPLYAVLRDRGVRFEFFHKVDALRLSADGARIDAIEGQVQARPAGDARYRPLITCSGRRAWPVRPLYDQLDAPETVRANGDIESDWAPAAGNTRFRLAHGEDYDAVVLGISVGALRGICGDLYDRLPRWRAMLDSARTTPAAGIQLWSNRSTQEMGWNDADPDLVTANAQPFATWADMSFLLAFEEGADKPRHLTYLCGPIPRREPPAGDAGANFPAEEHARVERILDTWLERHLATILPTATIDDIRHEMFIRANVNASDQYVLSPPGSIGQRLRPHESGVGNLFLAGDWTRNGLDAGAFESAVMSGLLCARAIGGHDIPVYGELD